MPSATLLIIDDNPDFRTIFQRKFSGLGYTVLGAPDGVRGLQLMLDNQPDLVLLDLNMPVRGGLETLRLLRSVQLQTKVILLTGFIDEADRLAAQALNVTDIILKPVSMKDLTEAIQTALKGA